MNREDIVKMARDVWGYSEAMTNDLANAYDMGFANACEQCAKVFDELETNSDAEFYGHEFSKAIRERGNP